MTRRADRRRDTVAEVKAAAWAELRSPGAAELSLRAVARRLGMAPSALYRYFASRDDLLTALIVDAFDELTATLGGAHRAARAGTPADRGAVFVQVAAAYRRWALADPTRYRLVFGTPVGGYAGTEETTAASLRSSQVLLDVMVELVEADGLDAERLASSIHPGAAHRLEQWSSVLPTPLPAPALAAAMDCYASLHGAIQLELNGHLPAPLRGSEEVFLDTMQRVVGSAVRR